MENSIKYVLTSPFHHCRFCSYHVRKWFRNESTETYKDEDGNVHQYKAVTYNSGFPTLKRHVQTDHGHYSAALEKHLGALDDILDYMDENWEG